MGTYCVTIEGKDFEMEFEEDGLLILGFLKTRHFQADSAEEAEHLAVNAIRTDPKIRNSVRNSRSNPPSLHLYSITELGQDDEPPETEQGYVFYPMDRDGNGGDRA